MAFIDHEGVAEYPYSVEDVFEAVLIGVSTLDGFEIDSSDKISSRIIIKAGISLFSWGENIPVTITKVSFSRTRVTILSTPKTGVLMGGAFDLGKNRKNIEQILEATSSMLRSRTPLDEISNSAAIDPVERLQKLVRHANVCMVLGNGRSAKKWPHSFEQHPAFFKWIIY
jgi:hypothetical protein